MAETRSSMRLLFLTAGIILAVAGQWILSTGKNTPPGLLLLAAAIIPTLIGLGLRPKSSIVFQPPPAHVFRRSIWRVVALGACVIAGLIAFTQNTNTDFAIGGIVEYQFTLVGVLGWAASVIIFLVVFWEPEKSLEEWREWLRAHVQSWRSGFEFRANWTTVAFAAVLLTGAFFYFYRIDRTPAEMTSDHAEKLLDVNDIMEGHFPVFFMRNTGREPLQFYVTAGLMELTGLPLSHLALKVGTALIGLLTIPGTFLLARAMYGNTVGLLAGFFVAVSRWPLAIARMGLRYPYTPFFAAASLYFVWRALVYQKRNDYLIAGLLLGAGLYGYIPSRNVPLGALGFVFLWLIVAGRKYVRSLRPFVVNVVLMFAVTLIVFLPLLRYSLDFPEMFWYRALTRVSSAEVAVQGSVPVIFAQNVWNLAQMFNWRGDSVWPTNISFQPAMDIVSGALLVLGVAIALYQLIRQHEVRHLFLLAGFVALLLPSALSIAFPNENPSLVRTGGAIPFACILLALPIAALVDEIRTVGIRRPVFPAALVAVLLAVVAGLNYRWYFIDYDKNYRENAQNSTEVAAVIHSFATSVGNLKHAYFIGYPYWLDGRAIAINLGDIRWDQYTLDVSELQLDDTQNQLFILNIGDAKNYDKLRMLYPSGQTLLNKSATEGHDFLSYFVAAREDGSETAKGKSP